MPYYDMQVHLITRNHPVTRSELQYIQSIHERVMRGDAGKSNKINRVVSNKRTADLFLAQDSQQLRRHSCKCNLQLSALTPINAFSVDARRRCASGLPSARSSPIFFFLLAETALMRNRNDGSRSQHS